MIFNGDLNGEPIEILAINDVKEIRYQNGELVENQEYWVHEAQLMMVHNYMFGLSESCVERKFGTLYMEMH